VRRLASKGICLLVFHSFHFWRSHRITARFWWTIWN